MTPAFLRSKEDRERAVLHLLHASSCFRGVAFGKYSNVCASLPCACAESIVALFQCAKSVDSGGKVENE